MSAKKDDSRCTTCDQWRGLDGYSRACPWMGCVYGTKPCPRWEAAGRRHAVAGRAREHMEAWDSMEEAVNERHKVLYEEQHGQFVSAQWKAELSAAIREANVVEHRTAEALAAALAPLVKEADHDRA